MKLNVTKVSNYYSLFLYQNWLLEAYETNVNCQVVGFDEKVEELRFYEN